MPTPLQLSWRHRSVVSGVHIRIDRRLQTAITSGEPSYTHGKAPSKLRLMSITRWVAVSQLHRRAMILVALVMTFAGLALILNQPERTSLAWVGIPLAVGGAAILVGIVWPAATRLQEAPASLASRLILRETWDGRLERLFSLIGVLLL